MNAVSIFAPYSLFRMSPETSHRGIRVLPRPSTVRYTDLGALASGPYSVRAAPSSGIPSILSTEVPAISAGLAADAAVSAATELP